MVLSLSLAISIAIILFMWIGFLIFIIFVKVVRTMALIGAFALLIFSFIIHWAIRSFIA